MKKLTILLIAIFLGSFSASYAIKTVVITPLVQSGIAKYKAQNYVGAMEDMQAAVKKNPNDSMAQYYLGNVYARIGKMDEAKAAYSAVIALNEHPGLMRYATLGIACLGENTAMSGGGEGGECAAAKTAAKVGETDIDKFIRSGDFIHNDAKTNIQESQLKSVQQLINSDSKDVNFSDFRYLNDASGVMPSDEEIAHAVRVLAKVGFNPLNMGTQSYSNPQLSQLSAFTGQTNSGNSAFNMLPFIMAQGNGEGYNNRMNPQLIQSMMMNQMLPSYDFSTTNSRGF